MSQMVELYAAVRLLCSNKRILQCLEFRLYSVSLCVTGLGLKIVDLMFEELNIQN